MSLIRPSQIAQEGAAVGDAIVWNGTEWGADAPGAGAGVDSFNTRTGPVTLLKADVTGTGLAASDIGAQPSDSDLTAIAALSTTTFGRSLLALADAAAGRTALALGTAATAATGDFDAVGAAAAAQAASQPLDADLTAIAALTTTTFGRSLLALADAAAGRTALGLGTAATAATGAFDAAGAAAAAQAASQPLDSDLTAIAALSTTSYGRSLLTAADAAAAKTLLALVKADVGLGSVDNTDDASKNVLSATKLTTARSIDGQSFDGTANVTVVAPGTHAAASKATPVDADEIPLVDSAASNVLKKLTWANLKATAKTYFDTLYAAISHTHAEADVTNLTTDLAAKASAPLLATKSANTGKTNATLADDPHLTVAVAANTTYQVDITLLVNGSASGDFKWTVSAPTGSTGTLAILNAVATSVTALPGAESVFAGLPVNDATGQTVGAIATSTVQVMRIVGVIAVAGTAGSVTLQWAQGTTNATATTVQANSHMRLQKTA